MEQKHTPKAYHLWPASKLVRVKVSPYSRWTDAEWYFNNPTAGQKKSRSVITWDFEMLDGSTFTHDQWVPLLNACRRLAWSLIVDPQCGRPLKVGSISSLSTTIRYFVRWMGRAGYANFGDLNEMTCQEFQEYVVADIVTEDTDDKGLSAGSISMYFSIWIKIYSQGSLLEAAGIRRMPRVPFGGKSAGEVAKEITETIAKRIPPMPDAVFLPVTQKAIEWLSVPADDILRLQDVYLSAHERGRRGLPYGPGNSPSSKAIAGRQAVQAFQFSAFPGSSEPWHQPLHIRTATPVRSGKYSIQRGAIQQLRDLVTELRDACSIVLQAFVGIRISEVCGLKALPIDPTTGMPACVEIQPSRSGLYEICYVKGQLFKTTETPITVTWVAGLRPRGATYFPPPIRALLVLEQLFRPWRTLAEVNDLIVSF